MDLRELLDAVASSAPQDWHMVPGFPVPGAVGFDLAGVPGEELATTNVRTHYYAAVLKRNASVSIAWALELERSLTFDFAKRMPDPSVSSYAADLMLSGVTLH